MHEAIEALSRKLLTIQGDGDYAAAKALTDDKGVVGQQLAADLQKLDAAGIPIDVRFSQGLDVLGLESYAAPATATPATR